MKTDEDEAFEQIEQARGWRKRQIANEVEFTRGLDPYPTGRWCATRPSTR